MRALVAGVAGGDDGERIHLRFTLHLFVWGADAPLGDSPYGKSPAERPRLICLPPAHGRMLP